MFLSNYKTLRRMLDKAEVAYRVYTTSEGPALSVTAGSYNQGVAGAYTEWQFDQTGKLLHVSVWTHSGSRAGTRGDTAA